MDAGRAHSEGEEEAMTDERAEDWEDRAERVVLKVLRLGLPLVLALLFLFGFYGALKIGLDW
jgi:hypothetical protein